MRYHTIHALYPHAYKEQMIMHYIVKCTQTFCYHGKTYVIGSYHPRYITILCMLLVLRYFSFDVTSSCQQTSSVSKWCSFLPSAPITHITHIIREIPPRVMSDVRSFCVDETVEN